MDEVSGVCRVVVGRPEGMRHKHRWDDNIKMDLQEVGCWGMGWIGLAQDRDRWRTRGNEFNKMQGISGLATTG
jgi:hypothetical protein